MGKQVKATCEKCGQEFERSEFHPYIKMCKPCRKGVVKGRVREKAHAEQQLTHPRRGKRFQWLSDGCNNNVKVNPCCIAKMQKWVDSGEYSGKVECCTTHKGGGITFVVVKGMVTIGSGEYDLIDGVLSLRSDMAERFLKKCRDKNKLA